LIITAKSKGSEVASELSPYFSSSFLDCPVIERKPPEDFTSKEKESSYLLIALKKRQGLA
jgi:hypothetical protein